MQTPAEEIDRLINEEFVDESKAVDFKREAYTPSTRHALIKDIMSMANALGASRRLIIVGVDSPAHGPRTWHPLNTFEDDANLQQVVHEYIEPIIPFAWRRHVVANGDHAGLYGILEVYGELNPPYIVKKPCSVGSKVQLRPGECWIRRGSSQHPASRSEFDAMYDGHDRFRDKVRVGLTHRIQKRLAVRAYGRHTYPSEKRAIQLTTQLAQSPLLARGPLATELAEARAQQGRWPEIDQSYFFEEVAIPLDVFILNEADQYIRNARVSLYLPLGPGVTVAQPPSQSPYRNGYPQIRTLENETIADMTGLTIEHKFLTPAFPSPLRLAFAPEMADHVYPIFCRIGGENLREPVAIGLEIEVHAP